MPSSRIRAVALVLLALAAATACRKSRPPTAPPSTQALPVLEVTKDQALLYTHVEPDGSFATTDKPEAVPEGARRLVRVIDPGQGANQRRDTSQVYVVDVNQLVQVGKATAKAMSREAFETGALAQLPPGESTPLAGPHGPSLPVEPPVSDQDAGAQPGGPPVVVLYGASWCGACKTARQYLASRRIPFAYKDVEKDTAAARELQAKAARLGVPADRVPILDVRGRLLIGFDRARLESLLGSPT